MKTFKHPSDTYQIALMAVEVKQARYAAYAAEKALATALETDAI